MNQKKTAGLSREKRHVASGEYFIGGTRPVVAQAFLGTCVGIAVIDAENGIGGLIHILLPEPPSYECVPDPSKYASTGLPTFLKALYEGGADPKTMRAWIAGGALMGPITGHDLALDTGGRSADISKNILAEEGIHIEYSETGGTGLWLWDAKNDGGGKVASGVYIYYITNDSSQKAKRKIAIIK